jgi:hypothetical protein
MLSLLLIQDDDSRYIEVQWRGRYLGTDVRYSMIVMPKSKGEIRKGIELCPVDGADYLDNDPFMASLVGSLFITASANRRHKT